MMQIACLWRIVVDVEGNNEDPNNVSWITAYAAGVDASNPYQVYCLAVYWALMTITTVGYGDVVREEAGHYPIRSHDPPVLTQPLALSCRLSCH